MLPSVLIFGDDFELLDPVFISDLNTHFDVIFVDERLLPLGRHRPYRQLLDDFAHLIRGFATAVELVQ